jgi:hypothetical protein
MRIYHILRRFYIYIYFFFELSYFINRINFKSTIFVNIIINSIDVINMCIVY